MKRSITLVAGPEIRGPYHYERFADELRLRCQSPVSLVPRLEPSVTGNGFILVHGASGLDRLFAQQSKGVPQRLAERVVVLQAGADSLELELIRYGLAAVVPPASWEHWAHGRWPDGGQCELYGLRSVAMRLGVDLDPLYRHPTYALLGNAMSLDLPSLLARYLDSYQQGLAKDPWPG